MPIEQYPTERARPMEMVLDLCLYRVVNEKCGGRILPFGVRQMIKDYAFVKFDNKTLREAVKLWGNDRADALLKYGDINDWDVSQVTNMFSLFHSTTFNDRIDRWDVRNVTSMAFLFFSAKVFNQPLDTWDVGQVTRMDSMFYLAKDFNQPLDTWDVRQVTTMNYMFYGASSFDQSLSSWDVGRVTDMEFMFAYSAVITSRLIRGKCARSFNQSLSIWDGYI